MIHKQVFALIKNVFENKQYLVPQIAWKREGVSPQIFYAIFSKAKNKLKCLIIDKNKYLFLLPMGINETCEMIFFAFPIEDINKGASKIGLNIAVGDFSEK